MNLHSLKNMVFLSLYLAKGRSPLSLVILLSLGICSGGAFKGIEHVVNIIIPVSSATGAAFFGGTSSLSPAAF